MLTAEMMFAGELAGLPTTRMEKTAAALNSLSLEELEGILRNVGIRQDNLLEKMAQADDLGREMAKQAFSVNDLKSGVSNIAGQASGKAKELSSLSGKQFAGRALLGAVEKGKGLRNTAVGAGVGATLAGGRAMLQRPGVDPNTGEQQSRLGNAGRAAVGGAIAGGAVGAASRQIVGGLASMKNPVSAGMRNAMQAGSETLPGQAANRARSTVSALGFAAKRPGLADKFRGMDRTGPLPAKPGTAVPGGGQGAPVEQPPAKLRVVPQLGPGSVVPSGEQVTQAAKSPVNQKAMPQQGTTVMGSRSPPVGVPDRHPPAPAQTPNQGWAENHPRASNPEARALGKSIKRNERRTNIIEKGRQGSSKAQGRVLSAADRESQRMDNLAKMRQASQAPPVPLAPLEKTKLLRTG